MANKNISEESIKNEIYHKLSGARGYVYFVNNCYYCIGASIFRECSSEETALYKEIIKELDKLENQSFDIERNDADKLMARFVTLLNTCDTIYEPLREKSSQQSLLALLDDCDTITFENIKLQYEKFIKLLDFKDGAYYRYSKDMEELKK